MLLAFLIEHSTSNIENSALRKRSIGIPISGHLLAGVGQPDPGGTTSDIELGTQSLK